MTLPCRLQDLLPADQLSLLLCPKKLSQHKPADHVPAAGGLLHRLSPVRCRSPEPSSDAHSGHGGRQVFHADHLAARIIKVLRRVAQLPDISRPGIMQQKIADLLRQAEVSVQLPAEMLQQKENVLSPLSEGRHHHSEGVEPVIQIPSETSLLHLLLQRLIGSGHNPHIHVDDGAAAHPHHLSFLENTQQFHLHGRAHAFHLIQEQGAAMGKFKESRPAAFFRPGKGSFLIAEEFALQQVFRHGRHIDSHKGALCPVGRAVDGVGQKLLARSRLSHDQHRALRHRHFQQDFLRPPDAVRLPQHIVYGVSGHMTFLKKLISQLVLAGLHLTELLHHRKSSDALFLAQHRHDGYGHVDPVQLRHPGGNLLFFRDSPVKWNVGKYLLSPLSHDQAALHPGDLTGLPVAGEDLPLFIDPHQALIQDFH